METSALPLVLATGCWLALGVWSAGPGWRLQEVRLRAVGEVPFGRGALLWWVLLIGAAALWVARDLAAVPGVVAVAMAGTVSMLVDSRTHRLPDAATVVICVGVALGVLSRVLVDEGGPLGPLPVVVAGVALWVVPLGLGSLVRGGVGLGDVKLAPVLGAMLGSISLEAAVGGFVLAFLGAGGAAVVGLVSGRTTLRTRVAMGPWLIGGALVAVLLWGVLPIRVPALLS